MTDLLTDVDNRHDSLTGEIDPASKLPAGAGFHAALHNDVNEAVNTIGAELAALYSVLGDLPQGTAESVAARIAVIEEEIAEVSAAKGLGVSVTSYGFKSGGDVTEPITKAIAALGGHIGTITIPGGTHTFKPSAGVGAVLTSGQVTLKGEGERVTALKCVHAPGAGARFLQATAGLLQVQDLTMEGPETFAAGDEVTGIACSGVDGIRVRCERVRFLRMNVGVRGYDGKKQRFELLDGEVDGGNIGLASGSDKQINVYGVLTSSIGLVRIDNMTFTRGGSNETGGTNQSHQIYLSHDTPLLLTNSQFYEHIAGRYLQFNGNSAGTPPKPELQVVSNAFFGKQQVSNIATHSSERGTIYHACVWEVEGIALEVKGPTTLAAGCIFRGTTGSGISIAFAAATSLAISAGVKFRGHPEIAIYSQGNVVEINDWGGDFEIEGTGILIAGGSGHKLRFHGTLVNHLSGNWLDISSGTVALLELSAGCDIGGAANRGIYLETGTTTTLLRLIGNYFHGNSSAVVKNGTVTTEISKLNRGYEDVSLGTVASATTITIPESVEVVEVTGTAEIKKINVSGKGRRVSLVFASTAKLVEGENLKFASVTPGANGGLTLVCNGTNWLKV